MRDPGFSSAQQTPIPRQIIRNVRVNPSFWRRFIRKVMASLEIYLFQVPGNLNMPLFVFSPGTLWLFPVGRIYERRKRGGKRNMNG